MKTPKTSKLMTLLLSVGCTMMTFFAHTSETIAETPFELSSINVDEIVRQKPNPIKLKKQKREIPVKRAISETARSENRDVSVPTNTFAGIGFNTPVFSDEDPLGFRALRELQENTMTKEALRKAIEASGHARGGASPDKTVILLKDGTRIETVIPVVDGVLNYDTEIILDNGATTNVFFDTYETSMVAFYGGTNITSIGDWGISEFSELVEVVCPEVTSIATGGCAWNPKLMLASFPKARTIEQQSFIYDYSLVAVDMQNLETMEEYNDPEYGIYGSQFVDCTNLTTVTFANLKDIRGYGAFMGCLKLESAYMPALTNLGVMTFYNCPKLKEVDISSIESWRFYANDYEKISNNWVNVATYDNLSPNDMISSHRYSLIGPFNQTSVKNLKFNMVDIPQCMFYGLTFNELTFPNAKTVGQQAFFQNKTLKFNLPLVETIGYESFYNCGMHDLMLPSVTNIGKRAFVLCENLKYISAPKVERLDLETFMQAGIQVIDMPNLTDLPAEGNLPNNRNSAFAYCNNMKEISLPKAKILGSNLFERNNGIRTVWATSCEELWRACFKGSEKMDELFFCDGVNGVNNVVQLSTAGGMALEIFGNIGHRVNVIVPDNLYSVWKTNETWASQNCDIYSWSNYKPVRVREFSPEVVDMGTTTNLVFSTKENRTFTVREDCSNPVFTIELTGLTSFYDYSIDKTMVNKMSGEAIVIVNRPGVTTLTSRKNDLGKSDFFLVSINGNNPLSINGPATVKFKYQTTGDTYTYVSGSGNSGELSAYLNVIPYVLITRDDITYETPNWSAQAKVTFQDGKTKDYEFDGVVTKQNTKYAGLQKSTDGEWNEPGITRVSLGEAVTGLDNGAFYKCPTLNEILLPNTVTNIGNNVFNGCTNLTAIVFSENLTDIGDHAFGGCNKISDLSLPSSVKTIGEHAFNGCTEIKNIAIHDSVEIIGTNAFQGCSNVNTVAILPNGGNVETLKQKLIQAGVTSTATWVTVTHRWSFNEEGNDYTDSITGTSASSFGDDPTLRATTGGKLVLRGDGSGKGSLNLGQNLLGTGNATIEIWAGWDEVKSYARVFDYGNGSYASNPGQTDCFFFTWSTAMDATRDIIQLKKSNFTAINKVGTMSVMERGKQYYFAFTFKTNRDGSTTVKWARRDATTGAIERSDEATVSDWTLATLVDKNSDFWLGVSKYIDDPDANASYDEVRIWNGALSHWQLENNAKAGPNSFTPRN